MRSFLTALLAGLILSFLIAPAASAELSIGRPTLLSGDERGIPFQDPRIAPAPDGTATVVWSKSTYEPPPNHAYVQFTQIGLDGSRTPVQSFDAGPAAAYYVDPAVATDDSGRALIVFAAVGGTVQAAFVSPEGVASSPQVIGTSTNTSYPRPQAAFTRDGRAFASWSGVGGRPSVVEIAADGTAGAVREISGGPGLTRLDMSDGPRLIWATGRFGSQFRGGVFSAPLRAGAEAGQVTQLLPPLPVRGAYESLAVAGGRLLVLRRLEGDVDTGEIVSASVDGRGKPVTLASASLPRGFPDPPGTDFRHLRVASGPRGSSLVTWLRRDKGSKPGGATVGAALLRGGRIVERIDGSFAGDAPNIADPTFVGRAGLIVAGGDTLYAAELSPRGRVVGARKLPGSSERRNRTVQVAPVGARDPGGFRVVWDAGDRGNGGLIKSSSGSISPR